MRLFLSLFYVVCLLTGTISASEPQPLVLVTIPAYQEIVQEMAGSSVTVRSVVPPEMNFHAYDPTPRQVMALTEANLWFTIGETLETKILAALQAVNRPPTIVDLRKGLPLLDDHEHNDEADPHIWTSPRLMQQQLITIRNALTAIFPTDKEAIEERYVGLQQRMDDILRAADRQLSEHKGKLIVIAHGAYAYLCRDYGLQQRPVEIGGKEATARRLHDLILEAKRKGVSTIFSIKQHPKQGIERIAEALQAEVVELDSYQPQYFVSMVQTIEAFRKALEEERA